MLCLDAYLLHCGHSLDSIYSAFHRFGFSLATTKMAFLCSDEGNGTLKSPEDIFLVYYDVVIYFISPTASLRTVGPVGPRLGATCVAGSFLDCEDSICLNANQTYCIPSGTFYHLLFLPLTFCCFANRTVFSEFCI